MIGALTTQMVLSTIRRVQPLDRLRLPVGGKVSASREEILRTVLRAREPLGPIASETLLKRHNKSFRELYDATSETHHTAGDESPVYIVGRKGAGKTAF